MSKKKIRIFLVITLALLLTISTLSVSYARKPDKPVDGYGVSAYAYAYGEGTLEYETTTTIPFPTNGPIKGIGHPTPTEFVIQSSGVYSITYNLSNVSYENKAYIFRNGSCLPGGGFPEGLSDFDNAIIADLSVGDIITITTDTPFFNSRGKGICIIKLSDN